MAMKKRSRSHSNKKKTPNNNIVKKEEEPPKASTTTTVQENRPHRSTTAAEEDNLGALEFAAALNGEDPRQVLDCLKRFVKIVQQDRRVALGEKGQHSQSHHHDHDDDDDDDDDDESSSEEENDVDDSNEEPQKKKFKASESWKEDTRDYHVPFVGTAVAKGGRDRGAVVVGQWPTGLLKAYLDKSPLAVELTGESLIPPTGQIHKSLLRNKQGKLSSAIYKAYLKALAELITAAIPVEKLSGTSATSDPNDNHKNSNNASNEKNSSSDPKYRFMSAILKERVPGILAILKEETKRGKAARAGPMTPYALQILSNLAMTSVENTRNLLRNMEQSLNEGIWRLIIRLPPQHKHNNDEREEGDGSIGKPKSNSQREVGRTAILKLAKAVLQTKDPTVFHHSSISGSKDRKVSPGILVLTLRDVCRDHFGDYDLASSSARYPPREAYYIAIAEFLQDLRDALWDPSARLLANRRWAELLSFDVLQNLCDISLHAPVLTKPGQFQTVLDINEEYGDSNSISPLQRAGLEARRLLWPLLMDPARSPFLQLLLHDKTPPTDRKGNAMEQTVVRTMCRLLDNHPSSGKLALHACLCHGMQVVPTLLPGLFQKLTVPDHTKHCFPFLARLRFISLVLRDGPSPSTSLRSNNLSSFVLEKNTDAILCTILPLCLKKNVFTKALQSKNALVVSETMKSLLRILQRLKVVRKDVKACSVDSEAEFWTRLSTKLSKFLPDLQVILSTLSRFDVLGKDPCARIVHSHLAQLLLWYASVLPELLQVAKFDWMKLLPNTSEGFNSLPPYVQLQLLRTLEAVLKLSNVAAVAPISCRLILEIMTTCKSRVIYKVAKRLCCFVLQSFTPVKVSDRETRQSVDYEITCWVECITLSDIPEFCDVLQHASELSFQSNIVFLRAWNSEGLPKPVPKLPVSSLLVAAITSENQRCSCSEGFAFLLNQVTSRCLLYHNNPLPLCALITYAQKLEVRAEYLAASPKQSSPISTTLLDYSESLVRYEQVTDKDRENRLKTLLAQYFSDESFYRRVSDALLRGKMGRDAVEKLFKNMPSEDLVAAMRLALHVFALYDGESMRHAHFPFLFQLLPVVLESDETKSDLLLENIYDRLEGCISLDLKMIDLCVMSQPRNTFPCVLQKRLEKLARTIVDADGSSPERQGQEVLLLYTFRKFLPDPILDRVGSVYLRLCCNDTEPANFDLVISLTTGYMEELLARSDIRHESSEATAIFEAWILLTNNLNRTGSLTLAFPTKMAAILESLICVYLSNASAACSQIFASSLSFAPEDLVGRILSTKNLNQSAGPSSCMIVHFLECDPCRFKPPFIELLSKVKNDKKLEGLWQAGSLDDALLCALSSGNLALDWNERRDQQIIELIMERALLMFTRLASGVLDTNDKLLEILSHIKKEFLARSEEINTIVDEIIQILKSSSFMKDIYRKMHTSTQRAFLDIALVLREVMDESQSQQADLKGKLSTLLFVRLNEMLPRALRKYTKALERDSKTEELLMPGTIVELICPIVGEFPCFDMQCLSEVDPKCMSSSLRACLKYGLMDFESMEAFAPIAPDCLRLARELVLGIDPSVASTGKESWDFPLPAEVYEMVVSHSNFHQSMTASNEGMDNARKLEIARLLLSCVSLSKTAIIFEKTIWEILFSAYNAGVSTIDSCLRRLFYLGTKKQGDAPLVPYLDQFRWRGIPLDDSTSKKQFLWDWLLNGLELGRVRQTLRKFPVHDGIVPAAVPEVEVWAFMEASSSDGVVDKFENETKINTFDNRYSPGYVLPLILGALENCLEENTAQETKKPLSCSETAEERNPKNEMLARVSQRLSDKGAVALALGALCSECKSVRQMAVSILGFFIRAAETEEARDISSWRERPQLTMLLHSVHRSLAIRRSVLFSEAKNEGQDLSKSHAWEVPQFSGFSALFLAHASLILARPGDNMYAAVNRFFLSIDSDHGAYQDMNRLPAFISMFCSSSDEPAGQARVERLWALELFKDGFLSEHCFRMAAACHAPELLLTSLNNVRMRSMTSNLKYQEEECLLIIEAIAQMVRRGGRNAAHSLFSRMGLLSWLRSLLVSDQLLEIVPATACRVALLELVSMAVSQAARYETINALSDDTPLLSEETAGLVQPTIQLCLSSIKHIQSLLNQKKSDSLLEDEKKSTLLVSSYDALSSLKASFQLIQKQRKRDDIHIRKHGMDLSSALKFLSLVSLSPQLDRRDVLGVLLSFPLCTDSDKNTALEFSEKILEVLGQGAFVDVSEEWVQNALERIHSILLVFMQRGSTDNACISSFVQKLLDCRTRCFQWRTCRALWLECLGEACRDGDGDEIMSEEAVTGSSAVSLAREILRNSRGLAM